MVNDGLRDFTSNYQNKKMIEWAPVELSKTERKTSGKPVIGNEIYRKDTALMPTYTGHVPGAKDK